MDDRTEPSNGLPLVDCAGAARERGEQHGEALREQIGAGLARWMDAIAGAHGVAPDAYIAEFVEGTDFLPAIRRWTLDLLEEVEGIARGSGQPWERIYAYNLLDEAWTWASDRKAGTASGCSAVGFAPLGGTPLLAQTMDIDRFHDGGQAVLRITGGADADVLLFTSAGMIGLTGCNSAGLALVVNNLDVLPSSRGGLPVAFVIRGILARRTLADAVAFVREVPHATGQHYGMAAPDGLASMEGWATGVAARVPGARLLHTNHPLCTDEVSGDAESRYAQSQTRERLAYLGGEAGATNDVPGIQRLLADRTVPISRGPERASMTFGAVVYACDVPARMWLAPGPPHLRAFLPMGWTADARRDMAPAI
jgi:isopenicillin-N N-acyltransferase like protein